MVVMRCNGSDIKMIYSKSNKSALPLVCCAVDGRLLGADEEIGNADREERASKPDFAPGCSAPGAASKL